MGFYIVTLATFYSMTFSFFMMISLKINPPEKWGEKPYVKTKIASRINILLRKSKNVCASRINWFHYIAFISSTIVFFFSLCVMIIDLFSKQCVYHSIGIMCVVIIAITTLLVPVFYEVFLITWWSIVDKKSNRNISTKRIKKIQNNKKTK